MLSKYEILGGAGDELALLVRFKDVASVIASQGGGTGQAAYALVPQFTTKEAYKKFSDQLTATARDKGIGLDVKVVSSGAASPSRHDLATGVVLGVGAVGVGYGIWRLVAYWLGRR